MPAAPTPAIALLRREGVPHTVHEYALPARHGRERDERPNYGIEAAAALGVDPARVFKTLVATVDDRLVIAVIPVTAELDLRALAAASGGRRAALADPQVAERASGSVVGGISPLAMRRPVPAVVDATAARHATILVSAGRRGLQVELAVGELVRLLRAEVVPISR